MSDVSTTLSYRDYRRAESFLSWNAEKLVSQTKVSPNWINDGNTFWYLLKDEDGKRFVFVDAASGEKRPAFDHERLAAELSRETGTYVTHNKLPFDEIDLNTANVMRFTIGEDDWQCALSDYQCTKLGSEDEPEMTELESPDGNWIAFARDHNLWIRNTSGEETRQLSKGGEEGLGYGSPIISPLIDAGLAKPDDSHYPIPELFPAAIWSPDSKKIISHQLDERNVGQYHLLQTVPLNGDTRQRMFSFPYPLPGDEELVKASLKIYDIESGHEIPVHLPPLDVYYFGTPLKRKKGKMAGNNVWWDEDSQKLYVTVRGRGFFTLELHVVDATTGESRRIISETSTTPIDPHLTSAGDPNIRVINGGEEILWFSQRDGWGHLYLYDGNSGELKRQLTSGPWVVADVMHVDEESRKVYFTGLGREEDRDPYFAHLYQVSLDGGDVELLTPEDMDHFIQFSPSGDYFTDTCSTVSTPPVTLLRAADGKLVCELERANIERLLATGWQPPERFKAKARDGTTDVYGVIFRPSTFDPSEHYPVLDNIYGGPQVNQSPVSFADLSRNNRASGFWQAQALAELGFIVVMIDGLGMPLRSKAYHDISYRNLGDAGLPDHIAALEQLSHRYPYLDLSRVGIFGHSGGGYASCRAMFTYPEFYKAAVSSSGNHDDPVYNPGWTERYMGYPVGDHYIDHSNKAHAANLEGKLFLVHGDMDENVHMAGTTLVVDALIKANKDFDLLIMPNRAHPLTDDPYFIRRRWDFFITHLIGATPPEGYKIQGKPEA